MKISIFHINMALTLAFTLTLFSSCHSDKEDEEWCLREDFKTELKLNLSVENSLYEYKTVEDTETREETRSDSQSLKLQYYVGIYKENKLVETINSLDHEVCLNLPLGKYTVIAWADYVPEESMFGHYFHIDDFTDILLKNKYNYNGMDDKKIGFFAAESVTVSYKTPETRMILKPAMGQYRIIATDEPDYNVSRIRINYHAGLPSSFDAINDKIAHVWNDVSFDAIPASTVAYDNVFSMPSETTLKVKLEVFDEAGKIRARRKSIEIPLIRGGFTTVKTKIYSVLEEYDTDNEGGGGFQEDYDTTIEITL